MLEKTLFETSVTWWRFCAIPQIVTGSWLHRELSVVRVRVSLTTCNPPVQGRADRIVCTNGTANTFSTTFYD